MQYTRTCAASLIVLGLILIGCSKEAPAPSPNDDTPADAPKPTQAALIVEVSESTYSVQGQTIKAIDEVRALVAQFETTAEIGFVVRIDESYQREGQLRLLLEPTDKETEPTDLQAKVDPFFDLLKQTFDQRVMEAITGEAAYQRNLVDTLTQRIKDMQQTLQVFQEERRGLPPTEASRLERRKLERQIETALQAQIQASNHAEALQKRIDRERYVTLLRVR